MEQSKVAVLSTFAQDKLYDESGLTIRQQKGGPALYLTQALEGENTPFIVESGPLMRVDILVTRKGEFGRIRKRPKPKRIEFARIRTPFLLVSTVLDEFDLKEIPDFAGKVFLDIQGYVRGARSFGNKKLWKPRKEIMEKIFCLKGTKEELQYMPPRFLKWQKQKILLVTNGKKGCEAFSKGKKYVIKPKKIIRSENTIGAGDTFFAYFTSQFMKNNDVPLSVEYATDKTSEFLSSLN